MLEARRFDWLCQPVYVFSGQFFWSQRPKAVRRLSQDSSRPKTIRVKEQGASTDAQAIRRCSSAHNPLLHQTHRLTRMYASPPGQHPTDSTPEARARSRATGDSGKPSLQKNKQPRRISSVCSRAFLLSMKDPSSSGPVIEADPQRSCPSCVLLKRVPQGQTESGGIVLAANAGPRVPSGGVTLKRRCTYRPYVIYFIVNKLLSLSPSPQTKHMYK